MKSIKEIMKEIYPHFKLHNVIIDYIDNGNFAHKAVQVADPFDLGDEALVFSLDLEMRKSGYNMGYAVELQGDMALEELDELSSSEKMMEYSPRVIFVDAEFMAITIADEISKGNMKIKEEII